MSQIQHRLNSDQLVTFALLNPRNFPAYKIHFPSGLLRSVPRYYPMIDIARLESELTCLYSNTSFSEIKTTSELSKFLVENSLSINFATVTSFLNIILTTPISSAESERSFSTLKRIKIFLRNRMGQDRLNALAVLSIHNDVVLGKAGRNFLYGISPKHFLSLRKRRTYSRNPSCRSYVPQFGNPGTHSAVAACLRRTNSLRNLIRPVPDE